jgi:hypothetical protein
MVLARGDTDEHLLHDPTIQRIGVGERVKRRQPDFFAVGPDPWSADLDFPTAEDDLTRDRPGARRRTLDLMLIPRPADRRPIVFEHRVEHLQAGGDGELHQLGPRIDEEIDERQVALAQGIDLVRPIDCARLSFHGGS